jgi:hypothetical protein
MTGNLTELVRRIAMTAKRRGKLHPMPQMKGQYHLNVLGPNYTPNVVRNWRKYKGFGQKITYCGQVSPRIASLQFFEFFGQL